MQGSTGAQGSTGPAGSFNNATASFTSVTAGTGSFITLTAGTGSFTTLNAASGTFTTLICTATGSFNQLTTAKSTIDDGSGNMTVGGTGTFGNIQINSLNGGANNAPLVALYAGMPTGSSVYLQTGQSQSTYNGTALGFTYVGAGNTGNSGSLAVFGKPNALTFYGNGQVSTAHSTLDDGSGNFSTSSTATSGLTIASHYAPSMALGQKTVFNVGASSTTASAAQISYVNNANPTGTSATFGIVGGPVALAVNAGGRVSTNTSSVAQNVLDDGTGNMAAAGAVAAHGTQSSGVTTTTAQMGVYAGGNGSAPTGSTAFIQGLTANAAAALPLQLNPQGGKVYSSSSTLDDGAGNIAAAGAVAAHGTQSSGVATTTAQMGVYAGGNGSAPTGSTAFIQGLTANAVAALPLQLNPYGGRVYSTSSTLDDGSGNMTVAGSMSIAPTTPGVAKLSLYGSIASATGFYYGFGANSSQLLYNSQAGHGWYSQTSATGVQTPLLVLNSSGSLTTTSPNGSVRSTLDDGLGNMTVAPTGSSSTFADFNVIKAGLGNGQVVVANFGQTTGTANGAAQLGYAFNTNYTGSSFSMGLVSSPNKLFVNGTGVVGTNHTTLDDGSGNLTVSGNISIAPTTAGLAKLSLFGSIASPTGFFYGFGANNAQLQYNSQAGHGWYSQTSVTGTQTPLLVLNSTGSLVTTNSNGSTRSVLDDGSGNLTTGGKLVVNGLISQSAGATGPNATLASFLSPSYYPNFIGNSMNIQYGSNTGGNNAAQLSYQYNNNGTSYMSLGLINNPLSLNIGNVGNVYTQRVTLDDGSGNLTASQLLGTSGTFSSGVRMGFLVAGTGTFSSLTGTSLALNSSLAFSATSTGPPATGTRSSGTQLLLDPTLSSTQYDYAIGMDPAGVGMWFSAPSTGKWTWAAATTGVGMNLDTTGTLSVGNMLISNSATVGPPTTGTRSTGTRIVLSPAVGAASLDYAMGVDNGSMWSSVPSAATGSWYWYSGGTTAPVASMNSAGNFSANQLVSGTGVIATGNVSTAGNLVFNTTTGSIQTLIGSKTFTLPSVSGQLSVGPSNFNVFQIAYTSAGSPFQFTSTSSSPSTTIGTTTTAITLPVGTFDVSQAHYNQGVAANSQTTIVVGATGGSYTVVGSLKAQSFYNSSVANQAATITTEAIVTVTAAASIALTYGTVGTTITGLAGMVYVRQIA